MGAQQAEEAVAAEQRRRATSVGQPLECLQPAGISAELQTSQVRQVIGVVPAGAIVRVLRWARDPDRGAPRAFLAAGEPSEATSRSPRSPSVSTSRCLADRGSPRSRSPRGSPRSRSTDSNGWPPGWVSLINQQGQQLFTNEPPDTWTSAPTSRALWLQVSELIPGRAHQLCGPRR